MPVPNIINKIQRLVEDVDICDESAERLVAELLQIIDNLKKISDEYEEILECQ